MIVNFNRSRSKMPSIILLIILMITRIIPLLADEIPVAYLAGNDCPTCVSNYASTVGMFRLDKKAWCFGKNMPGNITEHASATLNGKAYIIDGSGTADGDSRHEQPALANVFVFDPDSNAYSTAPNTTVPRQQPVAATGSDGKIYLTGGLTLQSLLFATNITEIFDGTSWILGPQTLIPRVGAGLVAVGNYLWLIGGAESVEFGTVKSVEYLFLNDTRAGWQQGPPLNTQRAYLGATAIGTLIYACGGYSVTQFAVEYFDTCESLAVNIDGAPLPNQYWQNRTSRMLKPRVGPTLLAYNNKAYAVGGYWMNDTSRTAALVVEEYDPVADTWSNFYNPLTDGPMPNDCDSCQAILLSVPDDVFTSCNGQWTLFKNRVTLLWFLLFHIMYLCWFTT